LAAMQFMKWLVTSSADPTRYSAMAKGALGMGVAYLIQLSAITCGAFLICVEATMLQSVVETVANIVYLRCLCRRGRKDGFDACREFEAHAAHRLILPEPRASLATLARIPA
jgi:hypothetical protein